MTVEEKVIWLAALLHDIGKFYERAFDSTPDNVRPFIAEARYSHEPYSAAFVQMYLGSWFDEKDLTTLRKLVLKHHKPENPDERLIQLADWLSASERDEAEDKTEGARGKSESVLRAIASRVKVPAKDDPPKLLVADEHPYYPYYPLKPLAFERETLIPATNHTGSLDKYRTMWDAFTEKVKRLQPGEVTTLYHLIRKYTWAIPSDTHHETVPDISLAEHLRTTAALAICLVREGWGTLTSSANAQTLTNALNRIHRTEPLSKGERTVAEKPIATLIKGDISGTQDFLYLLTSTLPISLKG